MIFSTEYVRRTDAKYWSPAERAQGVHNIMEQALAELVESGIPANELPTQWDRFCYAIEYVGQVALSIGNEQLIEVAKHLSAWLYNAHYSHPQELYGKSGDKPLIMTQQNVDHPRRPFEQTIKPLTNGQTPEPPKVGDAPN